MNEPIQAYPLQWPPGWMRAKGRKAAAFKHGGRGITVSHGMERVLHALSKMGVTRREVVVSTNVPVRLDGLPMSRMRDPSDPGAAVYWRKGKQQRCMAIDRYTCVEDNLAAIAATLEAMRAIDRHGGAEILDRAFTGFTALAAPEQWFTILGVGANATREEIEVAYRSLAMKHHPDRPGGDSTEMSRINTARDEGLQRAAQ
jgi:DnaJ domain